MKEGLVGTWRWDPLSSVGSAALVGAIEPCALRQDYPMADDDEKLTVIAKIQKHPPQQDCGLATERLLVEAA
jgi:hypothetical protein